MKVGDLIEDRVSGAIGIVADVRPNPIGCLTEYHILWATKSLTWPPPRCLQVTAMPEMYFEVIG